MRPAYSEIWADMRGDVAFSAGALYAFLLVLARIAGSFVLVPLPHMRSGAESGRLIAALATTIALLPLWPRFDSFPNRIGPVILDVAAEAFLGMSIGLAVAFFNEMMQAAAQLMSVQAGFGFASTIDPTTAADSGILLVIAQLVGGLLFLALGLDREVIRVFGASLAAHPPGGMFVASDFAEALWRFGSAIFTTGLRLAFPAIALFALIDLSLALLGRISAQLNLLHVSLPIKMLVALGLLAVLATLYPRVIGDQSAHMLAVARRAAGLESNGR